jgi:hypothetical protein
MKEQLFKRVESLGACWWKWFDIELNATNHYLVHLKGGVLFEIFKDEDGINFECHWPGCLLRTEPEDILAWMTMLEEQHK